MFQRNNELDPALVECDDETHNFTLYPTPKSQAKLSVAFYEVEEHVELKFLKKELINSTVFNKYYFVLNKEFSQSYLKWKSGRTTIRPVIDNSLFFQAGSTIMKKKALTDPTGYTFVNEKVWKILIKHFGGGPEMKILYTNSLVSLGNVRYFRVALYSQINSFKGFIFNKKTPSYDFLREVAESYGLEPDACKIHDFFGDTFYDKFNNHKSTKPMNRLLHNNLLVLENTNDEGLFNIFTSKKRLQNKALLLRKNIFQTVIITNGLVDQKSIKWLRKIMSCFGTQYITLSQVKNMILLLDDNHYFRSMGIKTKITDKLNGSLGTLLLVKKMLQREQTFRELEVDIDTNRIENACVTKQLLAVLERVKSLTRNIRIFDGRENMMKYFTKIFRRKDSYLSEQASKTELAVYI